MSLNNPSLPEPAIQRQGFAQRLKAIPAKSGVYLMRGDRGEVFYVGKASSLRKTLSVRQSLASSTAARVKLPLYWSSFDSNFSNRVKASAVEPANPATTFPSPKTRILLAFFFKIVLPKLTCPSPPMATESFLRTQIMVVA